MAREHEQEFIPEETVRTYDQGWARWAEFCTAAGLPEDAVTYGTLTMFVNWRWRQGCAPSTIRTNLTGLTVRAREKGITVDGGDIVTLKGLVSSYALREAKDGVPDRGHGQAPALPVAELRTTVAGLDVTAAAGLRDRVVLCLGFAIAARSAELAALRVCDIREVDEGLVVSVRVSKSGRRTVRVAYAPDPAVCPVRAWVAWRSYNRWIPALDGSESVVQAVHKAGAVQGRGMSTRAIRYLMDRLASRSQWEAAYTAHSLRAGFVTAARRGGSDVKAITDVSGHSPKGDQVYEYMRDADGWARENNATMTIWG